MSELANTAIYPGNLQSFSFISYNNYNSFCMFWHVNKNENIYIKLGFNEMIIQQKWTTHNIVIIELSFYLKSLLSGTVIIIYIKQKEVWNWTNQCWPEIQIKLNHVNTWHTAQSTSTEKDLQVLVQDLLLHNWLDPQAAETSTQEMQWLLEITRLMCVKM